MLKINKSLVFLISYLFFYIPLTTHCFAETHIVKITQGGKIFIPEKLTINKGDIVKWINNDDSIPAHLFASVPGSSTTGTPEIDITELKTYTTWEHTFNKPGRYPYFCFIHKNMVGEVIVRKEEL